MSTTNWMTKAARQIDSEIDRDLSNVGPPTVERIASIIAAHCPYAEAPKNEIDVMQLSTPIPGDFGCVFHKEKTDA